MPRFTAAFIYLAEGADPARREIFTDDWTQTHFVSVPSATEAAGAAAELHAEGLDLVELYGGLGATAAAAVIEATDGQVPVGLAGAEGHQPRGRQAVIFESPGADPVKDRYVHRHPAGRMTIVAAPDAESVLAVAQKLADEGATRIELCGGLGAAPAAAVLDSIGDRVSVGAVLFGFESLPSVAAYRKRFEDAVTASSASA